MISVGVSVSTDGVRLTIEKRHIPMQRPSGEVPVRTSALTQYLPLIISFVLTIVVSFLVRLTGA
ncbi:MAG: hypothetical protein UW69_C0073G0005 [Microgenomates group bacterium GW2011_GWA2_44_7]|uniref:Uncharacterized protein n=1 Tax=Candidatus Woesebacteria bacterium GW2011_GWA1_41_13b TaxID=1618555 RepID=A0A0G0X3A6_9BACT|nr:MAG: hypothetical protein UU42_C0023G0003 [Candidatus Woesebacteria bacterium GW2011_GWA1_41_13b]KKT73064.1 MAG: hypothetical protein UW69_C0073G0005 [Microgenomates group bacterium GW2011_GWA2_44_7]KKT76880.1 MAG: hypothetical protein UW73_C0034G0005 [Microgenomates group bacterium GW2011_GWB1_44_8]